MFLANALDTSLNGFVRVVSSPLIVSGAANDAIASRYRIWVWIMRASWIMVPFNPRLGKVVIAPHAGWQPIPLASSLTATVGACVSLSLGGGSEFMPWHQFALSSR